MSTQPTPEKMLRTAVAFWPSKTLLSAVEPGVFTTLAGGGGAALCEPVPHLRFASARDFLVSLVALGFLDRSSDSYANSASSLERNGPSVTFVRTGSCLGAWVCATSQAPLSSGEASTAGTRSNGHHKSRYGNATVPRALELSGELLRELAGGRSRAREAAG